MASQHWSRQMYTLWWRDSGTSRMRVSFAPDLDKLMRRVSRLNHDGSDPALYDPDGERIPFVAPEGTPMAKAKAKAKRKRAKAKSADVIPA